MDITKLKPSELIRVALNDLMRCYNDSEYEIAMDVWHVPNSSRDTYEGHEEYEDYTVCEVCLVGAVMAQTLGSSIKKALSPSSFSPLINSALRALNELRVGDVSVAFGYLDLGFAAGLKFDRGITSWDVNSIRFMGDMNQLADDLHAEGY